MRTCSINAGWALDQKLLCLGAHAHLLAGILLSQGVVSGTWVSGIMGPRYFPLEADPTKCANDAMAALNDIGFLYYKMDPHCDVETYEIQDRQYITKAPK